MKRFFLVFAGLVILLTAFFFLSKNIFFESSSTLLTQCMQKEYPYQRLACLKPYFRELTIKKDAAAAVEKAKELQKSKVIDDCHLASHYIGEASLEKSGGNVGAAFAACQLGCIEGCFHGVMESHISALHTNQGELPNLSRVCDGISEKPNLIRQCIHGVGHGLLRHDSSILVSSLKACDQFGRSSQVCRGGVYMQNMNNYLLIDEKSLIEKLPGICKAVIDMGIEDMINDCFVAIGEGLMFYTGHELNKAQELCSRLNMPYKDICIGAAAEELSINKKNL